MFSIVIVTWKNWGQCKRCIESIKHNSYYKNQIIVVQNESLIAGDNSDSADINIYKNIGLSKAANIGAMEAKKDFICLIDDDMEVFLGWDRGLLDAHKKAKSNWVASTMIEPNPSSTNVSMDKFKKKQSVPDVWYRNISNTPLLIPRDFWLEIGGYDEDFPVIGAELGLAKRAYDNGVRNFIQTPYSMVYHWQSQSISRLKYANIERERRDKNFKRKYGITRQEFIKMIGKGKVYDPSV